jgi:hypothetical protein
MQEKSKPKKRNQTKKRGRGKRGRDSESEDSTGPSSDSDQGEEEGPQEDEPAAASQVGDEEGPQDEDKPKAASALGEEGPQEDGVVRGPVPEAAADPDEARPFSPPHVSIATSLNWYEERRRRTQAKRAELIAAVGKAPHTTVAGWAALLNLPRGFYSLDVRYNELSYASYALLREHVAELEATKVPSPEQIIATTARRVASKSKREEKAAEAAAAASAASVAESPSPSQSQ